MLISKKMYEIIRVLITTKNSNISDVAKKSRITVGMASRILKRIEKSGYIKIDRNGVNLTNELKLLKFWGYSYSIREFDNIQFLGAERPQYMAKVIINIAMKENLQYAFTLFSATDIIRPYVLPSETYMYILEKDVKKWENVFREKNILPIKENGNIVCILTDEDFFENNIQKVSDANIVSIYQLYADLLSWGIRGEEAAEHIYELIQNTKK